MQIIINELFFFSVLKIGTVRSSLRQSTTVLGWQSFEHEIIRKIAIYELDLLVKININYQISPWEFQGWSMQWGWGWVPHYYWWRGRAPASIYLFSFIISYFLLFIYLLLLFIIYHLLFIYYWWHAQAPAGFIALTLLSIFGDKNEYCKINALFWILILKNIALKACFFRNKNFVWDLDSSLHKRSVHLACSELNEWTMSGLACPSNILDLARSDMPPIRQISGNYHTA